MPNFRFEPVPITRLTTIHLGDDDDWYLGTNGSDRVDAGRGSDYVSTGNGDDRIWANGNDSTWHGSSSSAYVNGGTLINAGSGNDTVSLGVDSQPSIMRLYLGLPSGGGSFHVQTGEGQDRVNVYDVDAVGIDAYDTDTLQDTFYFGSSFDGDATLNGVDSFDYIELRGGDWDLVSTARGQLVYENDTGGSVTITGITHGINDPSVFL